MSSQPTPGPHPTRATRPSVSAPPLTGERFGKFIRANLLGSGGMGEVWRAWDPELSRWVALKFLKGGDADELARFQREAQTAAQLAHPNIAAVYEVGSSAERHYIAMQYIDGRTLRAIPKDDRRLIVTLLRDAARALAYAHKRGVVHRDVKPENMMVEAGGRLFVMDFGLARTITADSSLSRSGMAIGTPAYMAPEQARGELSEVDARADVYGLGATLYELLTGRPPFAGNSSLDVLLAVIQEEPVPARRIDPTIDRDLETVVAKCLEKSKERRYADATSLAEDLDRWLKGEPVRARPVGAGERAARWIGRNRAIAAMAMIAVLAAGTGIAGILVSQSRSRGREEGLKELAALCGTVVERNGELRRALVPADKSRPALEAAVRAIDGYIARWPAQPQGYFIRARGRYYLGALAEAEQDIAKSLELAPEFRPAWSLLGMVKLELYREVLYVEDAMLRGEQYANKRLLDEALQAFDRGWELGKEADEARRWGLPPSREDQVQARIVSAYRLGIEGQSSKARAVIREALAEYRSEELLIFEANHLTAAAADQVRVLDEAIALAPGLARALFDRANLREHLRRSVDALADYDRAIAIQPAYAMAYNNRGNLRRRLGLPGALEDFNRALEIAPRFVMAYQNRSAEHWERGNRDAAFRDIETALAFEPRRSDVIMNRGVFKSELSDWKGALADFELAVECDPKSHLAFGNRGLARKQLGDVRGAREDYDRAVALAPKAAVALHNRGLLRAELGDHAGAIDDFTLSIGIEPSNAAAYVARANSKASLGDIEGAMEDFAEALTRNPNDAPALFNRGTLRMEQGDLAAAIADLDRAIEIRPTYTVAHVNRGTSLWKLGKGAEALLSMDRAIELDGKRGLSFYTRAVVKAGMGQIDAALLDYDEAIRLSPEMPEAWNNRGALRESKGRRDEAIADYDKAIGLKPGYAEAWYNRGVAREAKDPAGAMRDYTQAIALKPDYSMAYVNRGNAKRALRDLRGALDDYTKAIELDPRDPFAWSNRGIVHEVLEEKTLAVADLDRAIALRPKYPRALYHRAGLRAESGDTTGAIADYEAALAAAPANWAQRAEAVRRLQVMKK